MGTEGGPPTSSTLLGRLQQVPTDRQAWEIFVDAYGRMFYELCKRHGLQHADIEDVSQQVLERICKGIRTYDREKGKFRGWLYVVVTNAVKGYLKDRSRAGVSGDQVEQLLESIEARDEFWQRIEAESQWVHVLLAEAEVQCEFEPHTWQAYRLLTHEGLSGKEVAQRLDMKVGAVFMAKSKVLKRVREVARRLEGIDDAPQEPPDEPVSNP